MPPPPLSITTIRTGVETSRSAARRADVVQQAELAADDRRRPAAGLGGADPGRDQPVDPVGAAVAEEERVGRRAAEEALLIADRHAGGGVDEVAVRVGAAEGEVQRGLGDLPTGQLGLDRGAGAALCREPLLGRGPL